MVGLSKKGQSQNSEFEPDYMSSIWSRRNNHPRQETSYWYLSDSIANYLYMDGYIHHLLQMLENTMNLAETTSELLQDRSGTPEEWRPPSSPQQVWPFNTSFEHPLRSLDAQRFPDREHYIVIDPTQGYIRTTVADARQYAELGYTAFHLSGWPVEWDPPLKSSVTSREAIHDSAFKAQFEETRKAREQLQAEMDARSDDTHVHGMSSSPATTSIVLC